MPRKNEGRSRSTRASVREGVERKRGRMNAIKNTTHTPGPWTWDKDKPLLAADGSNVNGINRTNSELAANRSLIASAPDLLAALKAIVEANKSYGDVIGGTLLKN